MRDARGRSPAPRRIGRAVESFRDGIRPASVLASTQAAWREAVGEGIAAIAQPVTEQEGVVTVECESAVWAEELTLMETEIRGRLEAELGEMAPSRIRFRRT